MGVVSRRWVWVESMGVASGCGCKKVYRFPYMTYPYSSCICIFCSNIPTFVHFLYVFRSCTFTFWVIYVIIFLAV